MKKNRKTKKTVRVARRIVEQSGPVSESNGSGTAEPIGAAAERTPENSFRTSVAEGSERMAEETHTQTSVGVADPMPNGSDDDTAGTTAADVREAVRTSDGEVAEGEEVQELLAFKLADEEYAVDILLIKEIIRSVEVTRVPRRPAFIKGIISLRGKVIPIYDLRIRLGLKDAESGRDTRILVIAGEKGMIGVITDGVTGVIRVMSREVEPPPAVGSGSSGGHLKGVTRINGRLIILMDLEKTVWSE